MKLALVFFFLTFVAGSFGQSLTCGGAFAFCGQSTFVPSVEGLATDVANYSCLIDQPSPAWFYFRIASGNNVTIDFTNSNEVDIDYAIWGPFSSPDCAQIADLSVLPVACSFSASSVEQAFLPTVNPGEIYIMVITNFAQLPTVITANVNFQNTNGDLDCTIVSAFPSQEPSASSSPAPTGIATCDSATSLCGAVTVPHLGRNISAPEGPNFGCLLDVVDPWYFNFRIASGDRFALAFSSRQDADIDFALWGPFARPDCANINTEPVACSYSAQSTEFAVVNGTTAGDWYIGVVSNFDRIPIDLNVRLVAGNAQLDCGIFPSPPPIFFDVCGDGAVTGNEGCDFGNRGPNFWTRRCCNRQTCRYHFPGTNCAVRNGNPCRFRTCGGFQNDIGDCVRTRLPRSECINNN